VTTQKGWVDWPDMNCDKVGNVRLTRIATNTAESIELGRPLRNHEITVIAGYEGESMAGLIAMVRNGRIAAGSKVMNCRLGGQPCLPVYAGATGLGRTGREQRWS